ncbi:MAG: efflux RND transporter periplasmic adaptor subunit [Bdellovibrionales bacterium]|nr:efflux RND transporter periplasmic adaptor subunit [Bdellovibrionales bacterium]
MKINLFPIAALSACCFFASCSTDQGQGGGAPPATPVVVAAAVQRTLTESVSVVGSLVADEIVEIQSEIEGVVETASFEEGSRVEKDVVLFKIDAEKLQAEVSEAEANFELAAANLKRGKDLLKTKTISSKEYDQAVSSYHSTQATLERARQRFDDAVIRAPFAGIVGARMVSPGQRVSVGETLTSVVNLQTVKAEFGVPGRFLGQLKVGEKVRVKVEAYPDKIFTGEIYFVSPRIDTTTRTVLVKARMSNDENLLIHGMLASIDVGLQERENALVIPETAVIQRKDKQSVFAVGSGDIAELKEVKTGIRLKGEVEIIEGLQAGDLVVVEGTQKIGPGSPLRYAKPGDSTAKVEVKDKA